MDGKKCTENDVQPIEFGDDQMRTEPRISPKRAEGLLTILHVVFFRVPGTRIKKKISTCGIKKRHDVVFIK